MQRPGSSLHNTITLQTPQTDNDWQNYFELRWKILRAPWQQPPGSERDELEENSFHIMAITQTDQTVGVARIHQIDLLTAQIRYMAVLDSLQGTGIGSLMLARLEKQAQDWKTKTIFLNARDSALEFYLKKGYIKLAAAQTLYDRIPHTKMEKQL